MKVYEFGDKNKPSIMLFPGTCCYWKTNFGHVLDGLQEHFHTLVVSYSGFDDTENSTFISELDEVLKVENYIKDKLDGKLFAAYGCSLGGSFVSLLIGRQNIHIDHGIIGSSDMDQAPKWLAKLETAIMMPMFYPFITGKESGILKKVFEESMKNQFCTDLYTSVGEHINVPGTTIHVFYAKKMGEKYLERYRKCFADPDICEFDLQHEELLLDADRWIHEVCRVCGINHTL